MKYTIRTYFLEYRNLLQERMMNGDFLTERGTERREILLMDTPGRRHLTSDWACSDLHYLRQYWPAPLIVGFDAHLHTDQCFWPTFPGAPHLVSRLRLKSVKTVAGQSVLGVDLQSHTVSRGTRDVAFQTVVKLQIFLKFTRLENWEDLSHF